jgi:hypothetical protein
MYGTTAGDILGTKHDIPSRSGGNTLALRLTKNAAVPNVNARGGNGFDGSFHALDDGDDGIGDGVDHDDPLSITGFDDDPWEREIGVGVG